MDKKCFDIDIFWTTFRHYYSNMQMYNTMAEYYEGVCWGMACCAYNMDIISSNTFSLLSKLLRLNSKNRIKEGKYA